MTVSVGPVRITGACDPGARARVLTPEALAFVAELARAFEPRRRALLAARAERAARFAAGERPGFRPDTRAIREDGGWKVAPAPADLDDRRVEITGPVDRKMVVNALNSGASVFMADFEDATSPTFANLVEGQANLMDAVRRTIDFTSPEGKAYALAPKPATLLVRPRGWHLPEKHATLDALDGAPVAGAFFDFGLYFFHNARELVARGSGPYFYLPKLEAMEEAALWNDVFTHAQAAVGLPRGTIRATVLIETIPAAFEMEEILHALRPHAAGLNAGRWDYLFSIIKKLGGDPAFKFPDRAAVTMTTPFMRAYCRLLVQTCHRRGAHAMGGMSAFIPSRKDPAVNERAMKQVRADKEREAGDGFDGTWVAHPDLVPVAKAVFDGVLGARPHQKDRAPDADADRAIAAEDLLDVRIDGAGVTEAGVRDNVHAALAYLAEWLAGRGAVPIHDLMEDAATAEIARAQLWQWIKLGVIAPEAYHAARAAARDALPPSPHLDAASALLDALVLADEFPEFLTLPAYAQLP